ncbi:NAD-dependent epimerase/dehydratase family protein [Bradyrhizobium glycinis]|uniref:NAD-dependent epimerase/dehydratase family protein n=1 Tax=Bradyrhizobium glycinis TaxID=2751812 RepID=UPI001FE98D7C|nr:NAD-dependent epimerase/dehydratase family protein [Bradyrhizobium glycinis]
MKTALVFGATGFIGSHLLRDLLDSPDYSRVVTVARKPLAESHPKLRVLIGDLASLTASTLSSRLNFRLFKHLILVSIKHPQQLSLIRKSSRRLMLPSWSPSSVQPPLRKFRIFPCGQPRPRERLIAAIWGVLNPLLVGPADRYRGLAGNDIAHAIAKAARHQTEKVRIYHWKEMAALLRT